MNSEIIEDAILKLLGDVDDASPALYSKFSSILTKRLEACMDEFIRAHSENEPTGTDGTQLKIGSFFEDMLDVEKCLDEARRQLLADTLGHRLLTALKCLEEEDSNLAVSRLEHCLQTATRAERAGKSPHYVFCALLHDLGDYWAPYNHAGFAAALVAPYVDHDLAWMIAHHEMMQKCPDRSAARAACAPTLHRAFDMTTEFCERFDAPSHDPEYDSFSLEHFAPLLKEIMSSPMEMAAAPPFDLKVRDARAFMQAPKRRAY